MIEIPFFPLQMLEKLNLSHSHYLTQTPDLSNLPNLERLILKDCSSLQVVHPTIGHLYKLVLLNLKDCKSLYNLPRSIYKLRSLKTLILPGCSSVEKLEEDVAQMESLTTLIADNTAITKVPFSIVRLKGIGYIFLCGFEGLSHEVFPSLIWSWMSPRNNPLYLIQPLESLSSSLVSLNVPSWSLHGLSSIISEVPKLRSVFVECGPDISQISEVFARISDTLHVANQMQLETIMQRMEIDCYNQVHISASQTPSRCLIIQMGRNDQVTSTLIKKILQVCLLVPPIIIY